MTYNVSSGTLSLYTTYLLDYSDILVNENPNKNNNHFLANILTKRKLKHKLYSERKYGCGHNVAV